MTYKLGSLFDGSGGFPLAGSLCGITPVWAAEVEPYPIAVTRSRFPGMRHLGDISKVNGAEIEPVDIITFGSPCQDLSIAGKRAGMKHETNGDEETTRSGLFLEAVRIIREMREATNGIYPRFALWENVPGAFSSNKGRDFRLVLQELIQIVEPGAVMPEVPKGGWAYADHYSGDGWSLAYRLFDAQYIRTAQRRKRIHLILDLRGQCAGAVLFERPGLRGYPAQGGTPWQAAPAHAQRGPGADDRAGEGAFPYTLKIRSGCEGGGKGALVQEDKSATLATNNDQYLFQPMSLKEENWAESGVKNALRAGESKVSHCIVDRCILDDQGGQQITVRTDGKSPTLRAEMHGNIPAVLQAAGFKAGNGAKANGIGWQEEVAPTLAASPSGTNQVPAVVYDARGNGDGQTVNTVTGDHNNRITDYTSVVVEPKAFDHQEFGVYSETGKASTLKANGYKDPADLVTYVDTSHADDVVRVDDVVAPLQARDYKGGKLVQVQYIVRRLTPTECARLQGFPDRWGDIDEKDELTPEEYRFWLEVRNTHARINGKAEKDYTADQMLTWYNKLHTDSAEYKMWGNGIALPPAVYCMEGIVDALGGVTE